MPYFISFSVGFALCLNLASVHISDLLSVIPASDEETSHTTGGWKEIQGTSVSLSNDRMEMT